MFFSYIPVDGFTEAKIRSYGEEFMKIIQSICTPSSGSTVNQQTKKTIQDALAECPLPGAKLTASGEATYSMFKSGLTVHEIAVKRYNICILNCVSC